ncbi:MAG: ABC transporter ATP-binding protein [Candidatus Poseidoniaceae archaeon]|nr:ABC transporter ATP-binding protein [Candidatus Poseidoniaceae archaeon]
MSKPLLTLDNVSKRFSHVEALSNVSLTLKRGDIVGLVGGNGAGKTTLLRLMCGLYQPSEGEVNYHAETGVAPVTEMRNHLGVVPESTGLYYRLTAWENIRYHSRLHGLTDEESWISTLELAGELDFTEALGRPTRGFSKGMRQKTAIIRALAHRPEILLLDEPTAGLDVTSARMVRKLVAKMGAKGGTVIYSTHKLSEAQQVCDRIIIIHNGEVRADGSPSSLLEETGTNTLEEAYVHLTSDAAREDENVSDEGKIARVWRRLMTSKKLPKEVLEDE